MAADSKSRPGLLLRFPALRRLRVAGRTALRRMPVILQTACTDCGPACLTMVLGYFGSRVRLDEVRDAVGPGRDGADAARLLLGAERFGLRGRGVRIEDPNDLAFLPKGSILHWRFGHFVLLEKLTASGARIIDPASGRRLVTHDELRRSFTGVALILEPGERFQAAKQRRPGVGRYLAQIVGESALLTRVMVISVLLRIMALAMPIFTGLLVDRVVPQGDHHLLVVLASGLAMVTIFSVLSTLIRSHLMLQLRTQLDAKMSLEFLEHLVGLPYAFFQRRSAGDLLMRLNSNTTIRETLTASALSSVLDGALVTLYLGLLFVAHFKMALLVLVLGVLRILMFAATRRRFSELMSQGLQAQASSRNFQVQMLEGIETLKAMGAEQRAVERWSNLFVDELNISIAHGRLGALVDAALGCLSTLSPFLILAYGGLQVLNGTMSLGTMLALNALAIGFLEPISSVVDTAIQLQLMGSYVERLNDVFETPQEEDGRPASKAPELRGEICLQSVSFSYNPSAPLVVEDVDLEIDPGSFVAIVGPSGAGKSTLAKLLLGLYRPTAGTILFDGRDLAELDLRSLRAQLGIVPQQPFLFGTTVRDNIALADPGLPLSRIVEAARLAHIHDEISALPMAYDTLVGDSGASLSGGQRQRIAIARALVHRPPILLLDEATSSLDSVAERHIQNSLADLCCTRIVIAHRLSTVMAADLILVMNGGRVVETGTHNDLVERGAAYFQLVSAQMRQRDPAENTGHGELNICQA